MLSESLDVVVRSWASSILVICERLASFGINLTTLVEKPFYSLWEAQCREIGFSCLFFCSPACDHIREFDWLRLCTELVNRSNVFSRCMYMV